MNDDQLILYYYDDGLSARERQGIAAALEENPQLAARYAVLCQDLDGFAAQSQQRCEYHVMSGPR